MEDDKFGDPRTRTKRGRGHGGRGRGRGRGALQAATTVSKKKPDLGTNAYRFDDDERSDRCDDEDESAYDAGVDFEEVAEAAANAAMTGDGAVEIADAQEVPDDVLSELVVDFSKLDAVLAAAPLWVRLGEDARFALGVPPELGWDDVIDGSDYTDNGVGDAGDAGDAGDGGADVRDAENALPSKGDTGLLGDIAALALEDDGESETTGGSEAKVTTGVKVGVSVALDTGTDDFDKWLDDL